MRLAARQKSGPKGHFFEFCSLSLVASLPAARGCKESFPRSGKRPAPSAKPPDTIDTRRGCGPSKPPRELHRVCGGFLRVGQHRETGRRFAPPNLPGNFIGCAVVSFGWGSTGKQDGDSPLQTSPGELSSLRGCLCVRCFRRYIRAFLRRMLLWRAAFAVARGCFTLYSHLAAVSLV